MITHHLPRIRVLIVHDGVFERTEKIFLEAEMRQLLLLQKVHRQLSERVEREEADIGVVMAAHLFNISACVDANCIAISPG